MSLGAGSIAFTGFNSDGTDNLAFVALESIAAGTVIHFTDNEWGGSSFNTGENHWSWTATSDIAAGTVVTLDTLTALTPTSNLGTVAYSTTVARDLANSSEVVYAYVGTNSAPTFLAAIGNNNFSTSAGSLTNTGLVIGVTAIGLSAVRTNADIAAYNGQMAAANFSDLLPIINNALNWIWQDATGDQNADGIGPDAPFSTAPFVLDSTIQTVDFAADSLVVVEPEGDTGTRTITFTVHRTGPAVGAVTFSGSFAPGASATSAQNGDVMPDGADFGGVLPTTFSGTIADGATTGTVTFTIAGDTDIEINDAFRLTLTSVSNPNASHIFLGQSITALGVIANDDPAVIRAGETVTQTVGLLGAATLTIEQGGSLVAEDALRLNAGTAALGNLDVTVNNAGLLGVSGGDLFENAFTGLSTAGGRFVLNNQQTGVINAQVELSGAWRAGSEFILNNAGSIAAGDKSIRTESAGATVKIVINNLATGIIDSGADAETAMVVGGQLEINNAGRIIVPGSVGTTSGGGEAIEYTSANVKVHNLAGGWIEGSHHAVTGGKATTVVNDAGGTMIGRNGSAVNIDNSAAIENTVTVINRGLMQGKSQNYLDSDGDAIDVDGRVNIENWGTIEGLGHNGYHNGEPNVSEAIAAGAANITNHAGGRIYGYGRAIQVDNSGNESAYAPTTIVNEGLIQGDGNLPTGVTAAEVQLFAARIQGGEAINLVGSLADALTNGSTGTIVGGVKMGGGDDTVVNKGTITATGGSALNLGEGDDTFDAYIGSIASGLIDGGEGHDTLNLHATAGNDGLGKIGQFVNIEKVNVLGGNWMLESGAGNAAVEVANGAVLSLEQDTSSTGEIVVRNGGAVYAYGSTVGGTVESGGALHVYFGGSATGATVEAGGYMDVWNASVIGTSLHGNQQVLDGGSAVDTTVNSGGYQYVAGGGEAEGTIIEVGGVQHVDIAGTAISTSVRGVQHVYHGGQAFDSTVEAGGYQDVWSATVTGTVLVGNQQVLAGGSAIDTTIRNGGKQYVAASGATDGTIVAADGLQYVDVGATATDTKVNGGFLYVAGTANDTDVVNGVAQVGAGGVQNGVDFGGGAFSALMLDDASGLTGTVEDFEVGDFIGIANTSVSSFDFDGATLTLETSTGMIAYQFSGLAADAVFNVTSDGHGGSAIALLAQHAAGFGASSAGESSLLPQQDMTTVQPMLASAA